MTTSTSTGTIGIVAFGADHLDRQLEQFRQGEIDGAELTELVTALSGEPGDAVEIEVAAILDEILGDDETRAWRENIRSAENGHGDPVVKLSDEI